MLALERGDILEEFVEKSDRFATTLVESGTFGFLPDVPSAYTQPLYGWFLASLYWVFERSWPVVGLAQTAVAVGTALVVLEIGRRLRSVGVGVTAALIATLHPYLVWHDVHVNREVVDGFLLALLTLLALLAHERGSRGLAIAAGAVCGLAILGNSRLVLLPLALAPYLAWRARRWGPALVTGAAVVAAAALVVAPWLARNQGQIGCVTITTDARALWKANNPATYDTLRSGQWIDDVPDPPGFPPWPERAADLTLETGTPVTVDECEQMRDYQELVFEFWREQPGEKARLALQAASMLWRPDLTVETDDEGREGVADDLRRTVLPAFAIVLYGLALWGAFLAPRRYVSLAVLLLAYNTLAAMVFAGTLRYRAPFDFLLAVLAAFALERAWTWVRSRRRAYTAPDAR